MGLSTSVLLCHQDPMVDRCLACLKMAVAASLENLYTTALLSYTFSLAGDQDTRSKLITHLHLKAKTTGTWLSGS